MRERKKIFFKRWLVSEDTEVQKSSPKQEGYDLLLVSAGISAVPSLHFVCLFHSVQLIGAECQGL